MRALVTGAGGFIGGHLVRALLSAGHEVRAVDVKPLRDWWQAHPEAVNRAGLDLASPSGAADACAGIGEAFHLACDMGGMGFIEGNKSLCDLNLLLDGHMIDAARRAGVQRYFYASSACVYSAARQDAAEPLPLREDRDVEPVSPEDGYGWAKLTGEHMCRHFAADFGMGTRAGRLHSVFGPHGTWDGGREKVIAALCRKVAVARATRNHEIEVWGDGGQARSFLFADDAVEGILRVAGGDYPDPLNIGSDQAVTVDGLARMIAAIAGIEVTIRHVPGPLGVRGRASDNTLIGKHLGWQPSVPLAEGLGRTYEWISGQVRAAA
jgi:nucleoside-diphosphate-sugar epimerase